MMSPVIPRKEENSHEKGMGLEQFKKTCTGQKGVLKRQRGQLAGESAECCPAEENARINRGDRNGRYGSSVHRGCNGWLDRSDSVTKGSQGYVLRR